MNIAVDASGGDYAPPDVVEGTGCGYHAPYEVIKETI